MEVLLLGTGSADGWPNAWCRCASCTWARESGKVRSTTAALVDGVLLLDCGPDAPRNADRAGVGLADVRVVLLTHGHPDHVAPEALLARAWTTTSAPLHVLGPRTALDVCRDWIGPHDDVHLVEVSVGDSIDLATHGLPGYAVRVLDAAHDDGRPAGPDAVARGAVLFDLTAPDGARLLYATDTGPLPDSTVIAVSGAAFDLVLLEETFGRRADHRTGHLDLATFPLALARLREVGAVVEGTDVVAVHLSHHNPPEPELSRVLAAWGARVVDDLTRLRVGGVRLPSPPPRRRLLLGGARSGKSHEAERLLRAEPAVRYVATGGARDDDPEWGARIAVHRARRPGTWTTVETLDVAALLRAAAPGDPVLVDCLALWLAGCLDRSRVWSAEPGTAVYAESLSLVARDLDELVAAVAQTRAHVVLVSNEVGSGVVPEHASGRLYRDLLGTLNARVAAVCDDVDLVVAGHVVPLTTTQERHP
jgi:adenosylcobinamide kinase/adenosylcobinamide-phosphate guanylyltransferase